MNQRQPKSKIIASLPIARLPEGDICPPLEPEHDSWKIIDPWQDPLASRGSYRDQSHKRRIVLDGQPAIAWQPAVRNERAFIIGEPGWREYSLSCRLQALQQATTITADQPFGALPRAGLVFRMETVRRYYTFCLVQLRRLVLCRRHDEEWIELAGCDLTPPEQPITLQVKLDADTILAKCPELNLKFMVTDHNYPAGLAGFRALGMCRLFNLQVEMTSGQKKINGHRARSISKHTSQLSRQLPDEIEAGAIDLGKNHNLLVCTDFCREGRNDLLIGGPAGILARTWDGKELWRINQPLSHLVVSRKPTDGRRILYGLAGQRARGAGSDLGSTGQPVRRIIQDQLLAIDGATGIIVNQRKLPVSPREQDLRHYDLSFSTGCISNRSATDILVREWRQDWGGGGEHLWAFNPELKPLWHRTVFPGYGHHNAVHFFDYDDDGRDEILAGGTLLSADGDMIWRHDRADSFFHTPWGQHYDAALIGNYADDIELDPSVFLIGGSAGVYVVDGLTGKTRSQHLVGHAQWGLPCRVREDLPGQQIMVGTRWDNYGILTLFSGRGDRLWSIQPDYILQGCQPVQWLADGPQHIWCNQSLAALGLYDGYGRLVKPLEKMRKLYTDYTRKMITVLRPTPDSPDLLGLRIDNQIRLFKAAGQ